MGIQIMIFLLFIFLKHFTFVNSSSSSLSVGFYEQSCPQVENVIHEELVKKMSPKPLNMTIPGTLRLFFHDCYVQGCDGSVLITPTHENDSERNAPINLYLDRDAFDIVEKTKASLEKECPGIVSCSDILAILARDVVTWWKGPHWEVEKGRRDGLISNATEAELLMPRSNESITSLIRKFNSIGLSTMDLVILSGAHTIGFANCTEFASRILENDTSMDIRMREKVIGRFNSISEDQSLFFREFAKAMVKLGRIGVKTGKEGEIRKKCSAYNERPIAPTLPVDRVPPAPNPHAKEVTIPVWGLVLIIIASMVFTVLVGVVIWLVYRHFRTPPLPPPSTTPVQVAADAPVDIPLGLFRWLDDAANAPPPSSLQRMSHSRVSDFSTSRISDFSSSSSN